MACVATALRAMHLPDLEVLKMVPRSVTFVRRKALAVVASALGSLGLSGTAPAVQYDFLPITPMGTNTSQFTSNNGNGVINVTDTFPTGGAGAQNNNNAAIFPSQFTTLFPGTGQVQGHLAQTIYGHTSIVTFDLTGYNLSSSTVFGMWNTTDEVTAPAGGSPVYQVQLIDANNNQVNPTVNLIGNQDNQTQVAGRHRMLMSSTGEITFGQLLNAGGTHTDATFWDSIPAGTKQIIVYCDLPQLNSIGDGVGYYFAEVVPEPASLSVLAMGGLVMLRRARGRG
jgi:hypothetical protein